ncbi:MAG: heme lyase CcmF/NrfE family subunit [Nitrospinae bacterium]|nr:heme lyase CcmF/NrfE family subunit [Nitrospinota bacterium]
MIEIGELSLALSLAVSVYAAVASFWGGRANNDVLVRSGQNAYFALLGLLTAASAALLYAFVSRDFTVEYVYNYSNRDLAMFYTVSAFWAGQKGSLLLWAWMLSLFGTIAILQNRKKNRHIMPYVTGILAVSLIHFSSLMIFASPVFEKMTLIPPDGHGLNPMLQNPGMIFHPPTLYIGFVGFAIPFAFAMAALMRRQEGDIWIRSTRRWTIFSWFFLLMGNLLGANWAYVELGWGGYWAWDPVENASFMPWLVGTAYLHSVMIQEKKNMLKFWNVSLVATTFCLTMFGTFITRSGLISSVHSFGASTVGTQFGFFLILVVVFSVAMIALRRDMLQSENQLDSILSRESSFLFNNLILLGAAFAVMWGTTFPMISEAVRGVKITVGPPFFNIVMVPIGLFLLVLTGLCPLIAWRKASLDNLKRNFLIPFLAAVLGGAAMLALGMREFMAWLFFVAAVFVMATIVMEFIRGVRGRTAGGKENVLGGAYNLVARNKRRYGGYIIHAGMVAMFVGFTGNVWNQSVEASVKPGQQLKIGNYTVTYMGTEYSKPKPSVEEYVATLLLEQGGKKLGYLRPEKNFYHNLDQLSEEPPMPNSEVAIRSTLKEDVYVIFAALNDDNSATIKVLVNPLVIWLWIGGFIMGVGTIIAMWPDRREQKLLEAALAQTTTA